MVILAIPHFYFLCTKVFLLPMRFPPMHLLCSWITVFLFCSVLNASRRGHLFCSAVALDACTLLLEVSKGTMAENTRAFLWIQEKQSQLSSKFCFCYFPVNWRTWDPLSYHVMNKVTLWNHCTSFALLSLALQMIR